MGYYQVPDGFIMDPATGLYKNETIVMNEAGARFRHVVYFDDELGAYTQEMIPCAAPFSATEPVDWFDEEDDLEMVDLKADAKESARKPVAPYQKEMRYPAPTHTKSRKKWLLIGIPAGVLTLIIVILIISFNASKGPGPLPEEDLATYETEYFSQPVPQTTITGYEFEGGFTEGGIIR